MQLINSIRSEENSNSNKELLENIDFILVDEIKQFVEEALNKYGTVEKLQEANKVAGVLRDLLIKKKLLCENSHQSFVDIMIGAALLHNLFYDEKDWLTLFYARKNLEPIAKELRVNDQITNALFSTIEGQAGEDIPVTDCIPKPGTPTEVFSYVVWFVKNYL